MIGDIHTAGNVGRDIRGLLDEMRGLGAVSDGHGAPTVLEGYRDTKVGRAVSQGAL